MIDFVNRFYKYLEELTYNMILLAIMSKFAITLAKVNYNISDLSV